MIRQLLLSEPDLRADATPALSGAFVLLAEEFPTIAVEPLAQAAHAHVLQLDASQWRAPGFDPFEWDEHVFGAAAGCPEGNGLALHLTGSPREALAATALEILTRYQGLVGRRNADSEGPLFDAILARHLALHDLRKPLVVADYRHALDTWQWVLRLAPRADLALQIAALFHDVERLLSEPDARVEHHARDYQAFKDAHAARGADVACSLLSDVGVDDSTRERVRWLIGRHERPEADVCLTLLNDADALSFFSLNASGFARYFPLEHTRRKVVYTLGRLRPNQRWRLARVRLAPQVRRLLEEAIGAVTLPTTQQESA
ncbi:DUF4202 family protein [Vitiosangium sp. GDMCC 1.1324]|uniref:DUF4202 family protein n=1 Tax=Vitiosangium sp. (strain GDMCC 1.1324) TaxID=2138576 RepID=UPI000D3A9941|nr:DUF4202 family protein [Vitiosangium sp. GDMCC 1.1324]PTL81555.1 DUF4202 domain-containing protein [Vitiosangium sp. GDMCC 1.1324]